MTAAFDSFHGSTNQTVGSRHSPLTRHSPASRETARQKIRLSKDLSVSTTVFQLQEAGLTAEQQQSSDSRRTAEEVSHNRFRDANPMEAGIWNAHRNIALPCRRDAITYSWNAYDRINSAPGPTAAQGVTTNGLSKSRTHTLFQLLIPATHFR